MTDDRVTLPLAKTRAAAERLCNEICPDLWSSKTVLLSHDPICLMPLLAERDLLMAETYLATSISGDCMDPVKHGACSGCGCHCHTLKTGRMNK